MEAIDPKALVGIAGVPFVVAAMQGVKAAWPSLDPRWWPAVTLVLAIAWNVVLGVYLHSDLFLAVLVGLVTGLVASGLYSQARVATKT